MINNFCISTSALNPPRDTISMAATVEEGTARKQVRIVNARTQRQSLFKGDTGERIPEKNL